MSAPKKPSKAKTQYLRPINDIDVLLSTVRDQLFAAQTDEEKVQHRFQIDMLLDERVNIMRERDRS